MNFWAKLLAYPFEEARHRRHVFFGAPSILRGQPLLGGLVVKSGVADAVGAGQTGHARLHANGLVTKLYVGCRRLDGGLDIDAARMSVDQHVVARATAEQ